MYKVTVFNKMNNPVRFVFTMNIGEAVKKARNIAKAIGRKGGWTLVEKDESEQVTYFDYTR